MKKLVVFGLLATCSLAYAGEIASLHQKTVGSTPHAPSAPPRTERGNNQSTGVTEIGLERTACYGMCPVYTVVIKSDGTLRYRGEAHVKKVGSRTGTVPLWQFNQLARFIKDAEYMNLQNTYTAGVTDNPTVYTTVVMNAKRKVISNYANSGPTKLWAIEQIIDKLMLEATWDDEKPK